MKLLGNSPITELKSSISSLLILCRQSCLWYKCGNWYIQLRHPMGPLLWLLDMIWQSSTTGSSVFSNSKSTKSWKSRLHHPKRPAAKLTNTIQFFDFVVLLLCWSDSFLNYRLKLNGVNVWVQSRNVLYHCLLLFVMEHLLNS